VLFLQIIIHFKNIETNIYKIALHLLSSQYIFVEKIRQLNMNKIKLKLLSASKIYCKR
jgi:hypothetical protein